MLEQQPAPVKVLPPPPEQDDVLSGEFFGNPDKNPLISAHTLRVEKDARRKQFSGNSAVGGDTPKKKHIF